MAEAEIREFYEKLTQARKEMSDNLADYYLDQCYLSYPKPPKPIKGKAEFEEVMKQGKELPPDKRPTFESQIEHIRANPDGTGGIVRCSFTSSHGKKGSVLTFVYKKDGAWKVAEEAVTVFVE